MEHNQGVTPTGSGSRASHEDASASSPKASIPNAVASLRENADALHKYLGSFDKHVRSVSDPLFGRGGYGIEEKVHDLFHLTGRLAASITQGLRDTASAIEAQRATTVQQGVVHESAVGAAETPEHSSSHHPRDPDNG